eukprot:3564293-Prymnesium_polylepis.1
MEAAPAAAPLADPGRSFVRRSRHRHTWGRRGTGPTPLLARRRAVSSGATEDVSPLSERWMCRVAGGRGTSPIRIPQETFQRGPPQARPGPGREAANRTTSATIRFEM